MEEEEGGPGEDVTNDGVYKGAGNYQKFHLKREVMPRFSLSLSLSLHLSLSLSLSFDTCCC